jgi:hypothetical protein
MGGTFFALIWGLIAYSGEKYNHYQSFHDKGVSI